LVVPPFFARQLRRCSASGSFINVRSFSTKRFDAPDMGPSRRAPWWYYCPQSLSEYTRAFMDIAFQTGIIEYFKPDPTAGGAANSLYTPTFAFTGGTIAKVVFDVANDACVDVERHLTAAFARDYYSSPEIPIGLWYHISGLRQSRVGKCAGPGLNN
jgi:hypothetical protein